MHFRADLPGEIVHTYIRTFNAMLPLGRSSGFTKDLHTYLG